MQATIDPAAWRAGLDEVFARVAGRFAQASSRKRARAYLLGLLSQTERKNGWTLAELAGDAAPDGMQRLLNAYSWSADDVRDDLRGYVTAELGDPAGVLIADLCRYRDYAEGQGVGLVTEDGWLVAARHSYRPSRKASILSVGW